MDDGIEPLVIDNGTWMIKAGNAGDKTARVYVRTMIGTTPADHVRVLFYSVAINFFKF
jgi:actin-related protein